MIWIYDQDFSQECRRILSFVKFDIDEVFSVRSFYHELYYILDLEITKK